MSTRLGPVIAFSPTGDFAGLQDELKWIDPVSGRSFAE
jgi:hypothetical protein